MKEFLSRLDNNPRIRDEYKTSSYSYAHYLIEYCDGRANALWSMGIADELIDMLMQESGATNREFFESQNSVTICELFDYETLNDFILLQINNGE